MRLHPDLDERDSLPRTLAAVRRAVPDAHVLVIDDNSPDGAGAVADGIALRDADVHVLHRPGKAGLGPASVAGFRWALAQGFDVVAQMDADGSHRPEDLMSGRIVREALLRVAAWSVAPMLPAGRHGARLPRRSRAVRPAPATSLR